MNHIIDQLVQHNFVSVNVMTESQSSKIVAIDFSKLRTKNTAIIECHKCRKARRNVVKTCCPFCYSQDITIIGLDVG